MRALRHYPLCAAAILLAAAADRWIFRVNATTAALYMLLVVLAAATRWGLSESIFSSVAGVLSFNFFFLPPVGTFTISDPENWVALFAFLVTAVTASTLSSKSRTRAQEALAGRNQIARMFELSRALLMVDGEDAVRHSILRAAQILQVDRLGFLDLAAAQTYGNVEDSIVSAAEMANVAQTGEAILRPPLSVIPVRMGTHIVGSLAIVSASLTSELRDSVANLLAINYERAHALDRAAAAEVARRNEEFKSSMLDGLAHDLKTPLTAIRTCVTHMMTQPPRTEEIRLELLSIVDEESERLQSTITEAIELARIESRELHLERETAPLAPLIEDVIDEIRDENRERYSFSVPENLEVAADRPLLHRALMQLIENAKKYGPPGGRVRIEAARGEGGVTIDVLDEGPGFNPDELDRIFEKFYRGRRARGRVEGTGMGLAIARGIIEAHGGKIRASNRAAGGGAITMTLPPETEKR